VADEPFDPAGLVEIFAGIDPVQVRIAHDFLADAGIESFVFDDASSRMLGTTAAVPARLMVHADRAGEARERLKELGFAG